MKKFARALFVVAAVATFGLGTVQAQEFTPRNVECIAPAGAGGGWDFICRQIADILVQLDLVPGAIQTQNLVGAGGGLAFATVVNERAGDENLIVAASTATTSRIASGEFAGYDADDVRWLAALGADYGVISVSTDSAFQSFDDVLTAWAVDPRTVSVVGGSAVGGWDHLKVLLVADAAGLAVRDVRYTAFDGGGLARLEVIAGRADLFSGDVSETLPEIESGNLRPLLVLAPERLTGLLADVPTAREYGFDVVGSNWRGYYMPTGISDAAYDWWADAFRQVAASPEWAALRDANGLAPFELFGADMEAFAKKQVVDVQNLLRSIGAIQ